MTVIACCAVVELITDYLDEALSPEATNAVARHLDSCVACDGYLDEIRWTIEALGKLPPELPAPQIRTQLLATFRAWAATR